MLSLDYERIACVTFYAEAATADVADIEPSCFREQWSLTSFLRGLNLVQSWNEISVLSRPLYGAGKGEIMHGSYID